MVFFSPMPLLLAHGTMGIEMAIAPLWVERQLEDEHVIKSENNLTGVKCTKMLLHPSFSDRQKQQVQQDSTENVSKCQIAPYINIDRISIPSHQRTQWNQNRKVANQMVGLVHTPVRTRWEWVTTEIHQMLHQSSIHQYERNFEASI